MKVSKVPEDQVGFATRDFEKVNARIHLRI